MNENILIISKKIRSGLKKDKAVVLIFLLACTVGIISYFWKPESRFDLSVIYKITNNYRYFTLDESLKYMVSRGEILTMIYLFFMSFISNMSFIQVLPTFLFVFFSGLYLKECVNKSQKSDNNYLIATSLTICIILSRTTILYIFSSFRFWVAFIIFLYIIIKEYDEKKHGWLYYLIPILIHNSIMLFTVLLLVSKMNFKKAIITIVVAFVLVFSIQFSIDAFDETITTYNFIGELLRKYQLYFKPRIVLSNQFIFSTFEYVLYTVTFYCYSRNNSVIKISKFAGVLITFGILTLFLADLNFRNLEVLRYLMFPININVIYHLLNKKTVFKRLLISSIILLIIGGVFIQISIYRLDILPNFKLGGYYFIE